METVTLISRRERRIQFIYLLGLVCLLTALAGWAVFANYDYPQLSGTYLAEKIAQEKKIIQSGNQYTVLLDSTYRSIVTYQPETKAVFLEADINNQIDDIREIYANYRQDIRYKSFAQIADLYKMMYVDKKVLWSKQSNILLFKRQLEDCEAGFQNGLPPVSFPPPYQQRNP